jgi:hypothetical protein
MATTTLRLVPLVLLLCAAVSSESHWRFVTGVVTDSRGNELPHAVVQLENEITLSIRSYITGPDGRYYFSEVSADMDYKLTARYRTWWSRPHHLSRFDSPKRRDIRLVIPID